MERPRISGGSEFVKAMVSARLRPDKIMHLPPIDTLYETIQLPH